MPLQQFDSPVTVMDNSISQNEEYLQYRRLVYQELENGKRKSQDFISSVEIPTDFGSFALDMRYQISPTLQDYQRFHNEYRTEVDENTSDSQDELLKDSPTQQPVWDDSDLKTDLILSPPINTDLRYNTDNVKTQFLHFSEQKLPAEEDIVSEATDLLSHHSFHSTTSPGNVDNLKSDTTPPLSPSSLDSKKSNAKSHIIKQKNDRKAVLQKLSCEDTEQDTFSCGNNKPWYNPKMDRMNSQNLKICYINDTSSSSEGEENSKNADPTTPKSWVPPSPSLTPLSPTYLRKNFLNRMQSSSSISSTSSGGYRTSTSSPPIDREIINVRATVAVNETPPKVLSRQEELELEAKIAFTEAHQEAKRLAEEERRRSKRSSTSSFENISLTSLNGEIRSKVKSRSLNRRDCQAMSISQLQVILNSMHSEKEELNIELKSNLEMRDEVRTEQDAKLIDVEDLKAMLDQSGPETTV